MHGRDSIVSALKNELKLNQETLLSVKKVHIQIFTHMHSLLAFCRSMQPTKLTVESC